MRFMQKREALLGRSICKGETMNEKNELNDIILNKSSSSVGNKKVVLSVATLGVVLIVVIMLMNSISSRGTDNLPQAVLPPEPVKQTPSVTEEPLFEEVPVIEENSQQKDSLDAIAQKLKDESTKEQEQSKSVSSAKTAPQAQENSKEQPKQTQKQPVTQKQEAPKEAKKSTISPAGLYYIQVGSFQKNQPNKKLLEGISALGYNYKFHEVVINSKTLSKVLVGPFKDESEARKALLNLKNSVEKNAFLTKI
ncbi:MAG: DedD protein [Campylobacterota bacterium]|nr:DedD protein [Campylobacterota bacterium]